MLQKYFFLNLRYDPSQFASLQVPVGENIHQKLFYYKNLVASPVK